MKKSKRLVWQRIKTIKELQQDLKYLKLELGLRKKMLKN